MDQFCLILGNESTGMFDEDMKFEFCLDQMVVMLVELIQYLK